MGQLVKIHFSGMKEFREKLKGFKKGKAKQYLRKGVRAAGGVILKTARPLVPKESGTYKKSLAMRVKDRRRDKVSVAVVGARQKYFKEWKGKIRKPSKYAHLVENGRRGSIRFSITRGPYLLGGYRGKQPISRAVRISKAKAMKAMVDKLRQELELF